MQFQVAIHCFVLCAKSLESRHLWWLQIGKNPLVSVVHTKIFQHLRAKPHPQPSQIYGSFDTQIWHMVCLRLSGARVIYKLCTWGTHRSLQEPFMSKVSFATVWCMLPHMCRLQVLEQPSVKMPIRAFVSHCHVHNSQKWKNSLYFDTE